MESIVNINNRNRAQTAPEAVRKLLEIWNECLSEKWVHPLIALPAFTLDLLCIHPFRDGNGRVSRLLMLLQCYHLGYEVGRYISLERLIEQNKERYYETLEQSSQGWHEGIHDPWPYINYLLYILKTAHREFEDRVGQMGSPKGSKSEIVLAAVRKQTGEFRLADIERACPGVGREWIRVILAKLKKSGEVTCQGRVPPPAGFTAEERVVSLSKRISKGIVSPFSAISAVIRNFPAMEVFKLFFLLTSYRVISVRTVCSVVKGIAHAKAPSSPNGKRQINVRNGQRVNDSFFVWHKHTIVWYKHTL
jgi:hypothetical protein